MLGLQEDNWGLPKCEETFDMKFSCQFLNWSKIRCMVATVISREFHIQYFLLFVRSKALKLCVKMERWWWVAKHGPVAVLLGDQAQKVEPWIWWPKFLSTYLCLWWCRYCREANQLWLEVYLSGLNSCFSGSLFWKEPLIMVLNYLSVWRKLWCLNLENLQ